MRHQTVPIPTPRRRRETTTFLTVFLILIAAGAVSASTTGRAYDRVASGSDSLYNAAHPRLLFDTGDLPYLYDKVRDGGHDDDAYGFIRLMVDFIYPGDSEAVILDDDFGLSSVPMLAVATFLENPPDEAARLMGRNVTTYLATQYDVDGDPYNSSLRLRSLALGYDCFFADATEPERDVVRNEITAYIDTMVSDFNYTVQLYRPYLSNKSAMVAAAVGLAAIVLDGETDPQRVSDGLAFADELITKWTGHLVDTEGAYNEGVLYAGWSMRHLVYYFVARKRYDGLSYGGGKIREMEKWFAYELVPEGNGKTNNLNDSAYMDDPLPQHHTYFDWAQWEWQSGLSAYLYEHVAGPLGWDWGPKADKPATALWNLNLPPQQPDSLLPPSAVWKDRGMYYSRSGWPSGSASNDFVFSFYSGVFQGGHAQEDQNQFTLRAFGAELVIDHGPGTTARQTEAHNIVLIDGKGQHNAGSSIGTDGNITQFVLGGWSDFVQGDATAAYTTYSVLNNMGHPFIFSDWSWGYSGANPVLHAKRNILRVHAADGLPPYLFVGDDLDKDGGIHDYQWRLHTSIDNSVDTSGVETWINAATGRMIIHAVNPPRQSMATGLVTFNNLTAERDSRLLTFDATAANPWFSFLLLPGEGASPVPSVTRQPFAGGVLATLDWGSRNDLVVCNFSGGPVFASGLVDIETDALLVVVRLAGATPTRYLAAQARSLVIDGTPYIDISNGPANVALSGGVINIDRYDADFVLYGPGVTDIRYRSQRLHFVSQGDYLTPDATVGIGSDPPAAGPIAASAFPNPFNPNTSLRFEIRSRAHVSVAVFDALGRLVKRLSNRVYDAGPHVLSWNGTDETGQRVASGVYLVRIATPEQTATVKLTIVK